MRSRSLPFPQASVFEDTEPARLLVKQSGDIIAAFAIQAWASLDWSLPDVIIPMPGSAEMAIAFSERLRCPVANVFSCNRDLLCDLDAIDVNQIILLLNVSSSLEECAQAIRSLVAACPKRGYTLHLFLPACD